MGIYRSSRKRCGSVPTIICPESRFFGQLPRISDCAGRGTLVAVPVRMTTRAKYMLER
jgi:hypothetical protein